MPSAEYDADLVRVESQDRFPPDIQVGMQFEGYAGTDEGKKSGDDDGQVYTVTDIADGKVVVDGNHPLAWTTAALRLHRPRYSSRNLG
jgi:FKBP-type peptidyl-prolyl cis-trans isomerase SlyD